MLTEPTLPALCLSGSMVTDTDGIDLESCEYGQPLSFPAFVLSPDVTCKGIGRNYGWPAQAPKTSREGWSYLELNSSPHRKLVRAESQPWPDTGHLPSGAAVEPVSTTGFQKEERRLCPGPGSV